jgi:hypothetical protein
VSLAEVHRPPGGQAVLWASNGRYLDLLAARFGRPFLEYRAAWAAASLRGPAGDYPLSLDLAVNSGCQLSCVMCPLPARPERRRYRPMDSALYRRLVDQAAEGRIPSMTVGLASEPLMRPDLPELLARADWPGLMDLRLGTNGRALDGPVIDRILDTGLTRLEISVDAADPATYALVRPGGDLAALEAAIELFLAKRARRGQAFPLLRLSFIELDQNRGQLEAFLARWSGEADLFSVQRPIWFPGAKLSRPAGSAEALAGPPAASPADGTDPAVCVQPWQRLGVDHLGRIWPCCSWYGESLTGLDASAVGLAEAWRSLHALRRAHLEGRPPGPCLECAAHGAF